MSAAPVFRLCGGATPYNLEDAFRVMFPDCRRGCVTVAATLCRLLDPEAQLRALNASSDRVWELSK